MNSWTDTLLIVAIVVGVISAASLPVVSVNAISSDALKLRDARHEAPPWLMLRDDVHRRRVAAWQEASLIRSGRSAPVAGAAAQPPAHSSAAAAGIKALGMVEALPAAILDPAPATPARH